MKQMIKSMSLLLTGLVLGVLLGKVTFRTSSKDEIVSNISPVVSPLPQQRTSHHQLVDLAKLGQTMTSTSDGLKLAVIYGKIAHLSADEVEALLEQVALSTDSAVRRQREKFQDALIQRLLEIDPSRAIAAAFARYPNESASDAVDRTHRWVRPIFEKVAHEDLAEAKRLVAALPEDDAWLRRRAVEAILDRADTHDPGSLIEWAKSTNPGFDAFGESVSDFTEMRAYMITPDDDIFTRWAKEDLAGAKAYVLGLKSGKERSQGLVGIAEALAVTDPDSAVSFAAGLTNPNEQSAVWYRTIHLLASTRPADAARLLDQIPHGRIKQSAVNVLTEQWIQRDRSSALAWIETLGDSQLQQQVYQTAVFGIAEDDPAGAIDLAANLYGVETRRNAISEVTQQWFNEDAVSAIAWLKSHSSHEFSDEIHRFALPQYANEDPFGSAAYFDQLVAQHGLTENLSEAAGNIAYSLAGLDPDRAVVWVESLPDENTMQEAMEQVIYSIADDHLDHAMALAATQSELSDWAVYHLAESIAADDPGQAMKWIASQSEDLQRMAVNRVLMDLVRTNPTAAAEGLHASSGFLAEAEWNSLTKPADQIARTLAATNLQGALDWAAELPAGEVRNAAMSTPMHLWLQADPRAASEWIGQLEDASLRQQAAYQLADRVRDSDPEAAFLWSQTLHEDYRLAMMGEALRTWKDVDPEAAQQTLDATELTTDERLRLQRELGKD